MDGAVSTGVGLLGYNMFAYCNNNPVNMSDPNGDSPIPDCIRNDMQAWNVARGDYTPIKLPKNNRKSEKNTKFLAKITEELSI